VAGAGTSGKTIASRVILAAVRGSDETVTRPALPLGELVQPAPMAAVAILVVNDHLLKGSGLLPAWLTGKLSDFAGLFFFPLLCTALFDTIAAVARLPVDWTLRRSKILCAIALTAIGFTAIELSPTASAAYVRALDAIGITARSTPDATDLVALPSLGLAWLVARAHMRRVPSGRAAWALERRRSSGTSIAASLEDVLALQDGSPPRRVAVLELIAALEELHSAPRTAPDRANRALSTVRRS